MVYIKITNDHFQERNEFKESDRTELLLHYVQLYYCYNTEAFTYNLSKTYKACIIICEIFPWPQQ